MASSNGDAAPAARPHAPALGLTQRVLGRFHVTGVFWYRFPHWAFTHLPFWTERPAVVLFTTFFFLALGRIRGAIASNLEPVLGRPGPRAGGPAGAGWGCACRAAAGRCRSARPLGPGPPRSGGSRFSLSGKAVAACGPWSDLPSTPPAPPIATPTWPTPCAASRPRS